MNLFNSFNSSCEAPSGTSDGAAAAPPPKFVANAAGELHCIGVAIGSFATGDGSRRTERGVEHGLAAISFMADVA